MRFFVTGGTGFLGSHVVRELEERGHDVVAMVRRDSDTTALAGRRCELALGSLLSVDDLSAAMSGCDGVFHVAGNTSWFRKDAREVLSANVEGTRAVTAAMQRAGVRRGVLTSSVSGVGFTNDPARFADEETPHNWPSHFAYPRSKREAEAVAFSAPGVEMVAVNPATIFGPGDRRMSVGVIFDKMERRNFPRLRLGGISVCDVRDVAEGHVLAFERGQPGRRYILGAANVAYGDFVDAIASALDVEAPRTAVPPWVLRALAGIANAVESLGARLDTAAAHLWCMTRFMFHTTDRAVRELGYAPRSFADTLRDSVVWYRERGLLPSRAVPRLARATAPGKSAG